MTEPHDGPLRADCDHPIEEPPPAPVVAVVPEEEPPPGFVPARVACRSELRGWAGAHLHGAVRPGRRAPGRGRPPGRWC